jgi:hypothetical protein
MFAGRGFSHAFAEADGSDVQRRRRKADASLAAEKPEVRAEARPGALSVVIPRTARPSITHTGEGGPCLPTGRRLKGSDYAYVMEFDGDKIKHMTKIWHAGWAMKELGWV